MKRKLTKLFTLIALAVGFASAAWAANRTDWTLFCTEETYKVESGAGITQYDQSQNWFIFRAKLTSECMNGARLVKYGSSNSNYISVKTTADGKYRLEIWRNGKATLTKDSTVAVTSGSHTFAMLVRRGSSDANQLISVILYMDGAEISKIVHGQDGVADGEVFAGNPMANFTIGEDGKNNRITLYRTANVGSLPTQADGYTTDTATMVNIMADANEYFPPLVALFYGSTLVDGATYTGAGDVQYTLNANGNTAIAGGGIQISADKGVSVVPASGSIGNQAVTTIIKYTNYDTSSFTSSDAKVLVVNHNSASTYKDMIGAASTSDGNIWALWNNTTWDSNKTSSGAYGSTATDTKQFAFAWAQTATAVAAQGTKLFMDGANKALWSKLHGAEAIDSVWIGGPNESTTTKPATGMKILAIAVFGGCLSDAEIQNFVFPTEGRPVAKWTDFHNLSSGFYTWTNVGGTVNDDGSLTVGENGGLVLTVPTTIGKGIYTNRRMAMVLDVEVPADFDSERAICDIFVNNSHVNLTSSGTTIYQRWNNDTKDYGNCTWTPNVRRKIAITFNGYSSSNSDRGTYTHFDGVNKMANTGLITTGRNITKLAVGHYVGDTATKVANGMKVYGIELYDTNMTAYRPEICWNFDGNFTGTGITKPAVSGESTSNFVDSFGGQAVRIVSGSTHPYGTSWTYGSGSWTATTVAMPVADASNKIVLWTSGVNSGWAGLLSDSTNKKIIFAYGNGSTCTEICSATLPADFNAAYHLYTVRCDVNGGYEIFVDKNFAGAGTGTYTTSLPTGSYQIGAVNGGCPTGLARTTGTLIDDLRIYTYGLTDSEVSTVYNEFHNCYEATMTGDAKFSELDWTPSKPADGFEANAVLTIKNTAAAALTLDENVSVATILAENAAGNALTLKYTNRTVDAEYDFSGAAGGVTLDASGIPSGNIARYAVVGAPYSYWLARGANIGTPTVTGVPTAPTGYTFTQETVEGYGIRVVATTTLTDAINTGSVSVNISNGTDIGTGTHGLYPVYKVDWNHLTASKLSDTFSGATFTLSGKTGTFYGCGGTQDLIQKDYVDDGNEQSITLTIENVPYEKYRIITYLNSDSGDVPFVPVKINGTYYAGLTTDGTASTTVKGRSANWGKSNSRATMAEGINVVVSDVLTEDTAVVDLYTVNRGTARGTPAAYQIIEVGVVAKIGDAVYGSVTEAIEAATSGDTITLMRDWYEAVTADKSVTLDLNDKTFTGSLAIAQNSELTLSGSNVTLSGVTGAGTLKVAGGITVTANNGSDGYAVNGAVVTIDNGTFKLNNGNSDAKVTDATFNLGENGTLDNKGWLTFSGTVTLNSNLASNKDVLNNAGGNQSSIRGDGTIVKTGTGTITIKSLLQASDDTIHKHPVTVSAGTLMLTHGTYPLGALSGSGILGYNGGNATAFPGAPESTTDWTGTVWFKSYEFKPCNGFANFANANSKIKLTSCKGYAPNSNLSNENLEFVLEDDGDTAAWDINNGYGGGTYHFQMGKLTGTGTFKGSNNPAQNYAAKDGSEFAGTITLLYKGVIFTFGTSVLKKVSGSGGYIRVDSGYAANVAAGKIWTATGGFDVNGTIGGAGTLSGDVTFGDNAEICATNGTLTVTGTLSFGTDVKVRVATTPTTAAPVKVLTKTGSGIIANVKVLVGDSATALTGSFRAFYQGDGVYVAPYETHALTMEADTTWEALVSGTTIAAHDDVTVTPNGHKLTFTQKVTETYTLTIDGNVTIAAGDALYHDGCWEDAVATFGTVTITGDITSEIKDGFFGAFSASSNSIKLRAQNKEVISINIAGGQGGSSTEVVASADDHKVTGSEYYGIAPTLGSSWNNIDGQFQGRDPAYTISIEAPYAYDGEKTVQRPTMSLSAAGKNTWDASLTNPFLRGYLDDGLGVTVMVHGIPYTSYDVIIYGTSDRTDTGIAPIEVNGKKYSYVDGEVVVSDTAWGTGMYATPELGKNALCVTNCSGDTLTINATRKGYTGAGTGRATLCAVQVVCKGDVVVAANYYGNVNGTATWTDGEDDKNIEKLGLGWANSQLSTLTLTNKANATLTFDPPAETLTGMTFKVVSAADCKLTIPADSLEKLNFSVLDFSEAYGKVEINLDDVAEGSEKTLLAGTLSGDTNVTYKSTGNWGAYADATGIHMAQKVTDKAKKNPVTGESKDFTFKYVGTDGDWNKAANWRKVDNGLWMPTTAVPGSSGTDCYQPLFIDSDSNVSFADNLEGWNISYAFLGGAKVTVNKLKKMQGSGVVPFIWVDKDSSVTFNTVGADSDNWTALDLYIAATNGATFSAIAQTMTKCTVNYYLTNNATVKFTGAVAAGTHTIKAMSLEVGETKSAHHVEKKTLVTLSAAGVTFVKDANIAVSLDNKNVTPTYIETIPACTNDVGTYTIATEPDGVYAYVVQYADNWDVVDPLTAVVPDKVTTNWSALEWTDKFGHAPYAIVGTHDYIVNASNATATLNFTETVTTAKSITLKNDVDDVLTLTKGAEVTAPTFTYSGVAGKAVIGWSVSALASSTDNVAYAGGAGTEASRVQIAHNGGTLNLEGGTYKLAASFNGTDTTVNMKDITADYVIPSGNYYAFAVGKANYTLAGNTKITAPSFWLAQGQVGWNSVFTMQNTAQLIVTGEINEDSNHSSVMFGHWDASTVFTLKDDAYFAATNAQVLVGKSGNTHTINLDGGTFVAKGIKAAGYASGANTLNLGGATLVLGDVGIDTYNSSRTIAVNVTNDSMIASLAAMPITQTVTVNAGKTLTLDATEGQITIRKAVANNGTITVTGGTVLFMPGTFNGAINATGEGAVKFGYYIDINDAGVFTIPDGKTKDQIVLLNGKGETVTPTKIEGGKIYYDCKMTDFPAWWAYEFNTNLNNDGTEGTALTWDGGSAFAKENAYVTNIVQKGEVAVTNIGIRVPCRPYRGVETWPETTTFIMYGKVPSEDNTTVIGFGSQTVGDNKNTIFLAVGDADKGEVKLCQVNAFSAATELCSMSVANATTTDHLYAFVLKVVNGKTVVNTYLDGQLLQPYTFAGEIALGKGFQLGSIHGGYDNSGYTAPTVASDQSVMNFLRVYEKELNSSAMAKYATEYPYESPNGVFSRELDGTDGTWVQMAQWSSNGTEQVDAPLANGVVQITATADTGIAVNLDSDVTYESIAFGGSGKITLTNDTAKSAGIVKIAGRIGINTDTVLANDAFETIGSAISISDGKKLTLDCASVDVGTYWTSESVDLTGAVICNDYDEQVELKLPNVKLPRTATKRLDAQTLHIWVDIAVPTDPIIGTVDGDTVTWSWAGVTIDEADIDFDQDEVEIRIVMAKDANFTLNEKYAKAALITVDGGNLNIGTNRNMTVTGTGTVDAQLSDEEKASTSDVTLFNVSGAASLAYRTVTDKDGATLDVIGSNGKVRVRPATTLEGLMFYMACPKPSYGERDPNGRQSGWIDLVNYGPDSVDLADYKLVRCNMGKTFKLTETDGAVSNLLTKTLAKGETFRVYTSEEYPTAEDYGGTGREVAWFTKNAQGKVVKSDSATGSIMVVPTKVNPKKYPMVRLYKGTEATGFAVADEVVIPCDIDDDAVVEFGTDATKRERWVVQGSVRTEYGPDVNSLYGVSKAKTDLALLTTEKGFVTAGKDFKVELPVNPFGTNGVALANNEIASVVLEYRTFDDSKEEDAMTTTELAMAKVDKADAKKGQLWTNSIPASVMAAGKLIQYRAKITDVGGKTFYAPRFLNSDIGYKWYGAVVQPETADVPTKDGAVCTTGLQTFLMFACGENKKQMDYDVDNQTLPNKARVAIFDTQTGTYYDNVRVDLRGQTSASFYKLSHGFRFSKVAPLVCTNPFDGEEIECRKTSFIAEYGDPIYLRQTLALQVMREAGVKAPFDYPVRLYLNGKFYQLAFHSNRFTDEIVEDYYGLNAKTGCAYKNVKQLLASQLRNMGTDPSPTEKKTPDDDNESDLSVLIGYADEIDDSKDATALTTFAMKKFNIPAWVNYMAATKITQEADDVWTNLGIYINQYDEFYNPNGDDTMMPLAYDQNLSFGQWYYADDKDRGRSGIVATNDTMKSHPFYGGKDIRYHQIGGSVYGGYNRGMETIFQNATFREALVRRIRTLADRFLGAPGTAKADTPIWQWLEVYKEAIADDVAPDRERWLYESKVMTTASNIWVWDTPLGFDDGITDLWENYIVPRRQHLYVTHSETNDAKVVGYAQDKNAGIPVSQAATADLANQIYVTDLTGKKNTEDGFNVSNGAFYLCNGNAAAIDISGWQLSGFAKATFAQGTVLPGKKDSVDGKLVVVYDRIASRDVLAGLGIDNPVVVNMDKAAGDHFTEGNTIVTLLDDEDTEVKGTKFYITKAEGTDPSASQEQPAGTASIEISTAWMEQHGIKTDVTSAELATSMTTPMEGGNGITPWESYALGLEPENEESKPVIAPVQSADASKVTFKLDNVAPVDGATVTYKVKAGTTPGGSDIGESEEVAYGSTQQMALPTEGVRYYTIEVKTVTETVTQ